MQLGYKDKAWSVNRLSLVARRHGCYEACHRLINSLYGYNAMEVQEAFAKIRQQVLPPALPPSVLSSTFGLYLSCSFCAWPYHEYIFLWSKQTLKTHVSVVLDSWFE